jgi:DNA recombination protein RmuC
MDGLLAATLIALAAMVAAGGTWLAIHGRIKLAGERARAEASQERAKLEERLEARGRETERLANDLEARENALEAQNVRVADLQTQLGSLNTLLQQERKAAQEKLQLLEDAKTKLSDAFKTLSFEALSANSREFLTLAGTRFETLSQGAEQELAKRETAITVLVDPISKALEKVEKELKDLELARETAYSALTAQVGAMATTETDLRKETSALVKALRRPTVRGTWGEMQLTRAVEFAGMLERCDFKKQETTTTETGKLRPDLIVTLPGAKTVVVDSKAPLEHYLNALEAQDEERREGELKEYVDGIKTHIRQLSSVLPPVSWTLR